MVFENKNSSFNNEVEVEIKIKQSHLIIQFCNKAKIVLLFDVKSVYISCTSHHANSVRTVKNTFPRLVMRLLLCVDAELDNICTS